MARSSVERPAAVRGWWAAGLLAVLMIALPVSAGFIEEFYSRLAYRWLQRGLTSISNLVPFAVLDVLIAGTLLGILLRIVWLLRAAWHRGPLAALSEGIRRLIRTGGLVIIAFVTVTTPITLMVLVRAAVFRDDSESDETASDKVTTER